MKLAGKYMMRELAPKTIFRQETPRREFGKLRIGFSDAAPSKEILRGHPQIAFDKEGLGFNLDEFDF